MEKSQKSVITRILMTFAIVFTITLAGGISAKAALSAPTGLAQSGASKDSVSITYNEVAGAEEYAIQIANNASFTNAVTGTTTSRSPYIDSADGLTIAPGSSYWVRVAAIDSNGAAGAWSSALEVVTKPGSAPTNLVHTGSTTNSITLQWSAVEGANCYEVAYCESGSSDFVNVETTTNSVTLSGLSKNAEYYVDVTAARKSSSGAVAENTTGTYIGSVPVTPSKASVKLGYHSGKSVRLDWNEICCEDGYEVQLYTAYKNKDSKIKTYKKETYSNYAYISNSKLKKSNFYKLRVRTYCKDSSGKKYYSKWSSFVYTCDQPDVKRMESTANGLHTTWEKVNGTDRYVVYVSTKQKSGYKKSGTTKNNSITVTKYGKSKLQSGKRYYVYVVPQVKAGGKWYSCKASWCWSQIYSR